MHVPWPMGLETLARIGHTVLRNNRIDENCPEKPLPTAVHFGVAPSLSSSPQAISMSWN